MIDTSSCLGITRDPFYCSIPFVLFCFICFIPLLPIEDWFCLNIEWCVMADHFLFMWIVFSFTAQFHATDRFLKLKNLRINGVLHGSKDRLNGENYSSSFLLSIWYSVNNKRKLLISFHSKPFQLYYIISCTGH